MNAAFQIQKPKEFNHIQSLQAPPMMQPNIGQPKRCKLDPFCVQINQKAKKDVDTGDSNIQVEIPIKKELNWKMDIPITVKEFDFGSKSQNVYQKVVSVTIASEFNQSFPQRHKIALMDVTEDLFFSWTFNCNPFTYKTLAKQMKWILPEVAGDAFYETFKRFGYLFRECAEKVASDPTRYYAHLNVSPDKCLATLVFGEAVNNYRALELLAMDFIPTPWEDIKVDVLNDNQLTQQDHKSIKMKLVKMLEIVSFYQPVLLLSLDNVNDAITAPSRKNWLQSLQKSNTEIEFDPKVMLDDAMNEESILTKSFLVPINDTINSKTMTRELAFVFYYKKTRNGTSSYSIEIIDRNDPFFSFVSTPITPEKFQAMTNDLNTNDKQSKRISRLLNSSRVVYESTNGHFHEAKGNQNVGFHDPTGERGVIGIIAGDFMQGVIDQPDRYRAELRIEFQKDPKTRYPREMKLLEANLHKPVPARATLTITEQVLFKDRSSISIEFRNTDLSRLQDQIRQQFHEAKHQTAATKARLEQILKTVRTKNIALYALLDKPFRRQSLETTEMNPESEEYQYGYKPWTSSTSKSMQKLKLNSNIQTPKEVKIMPSRTVVGTRIPIAVPAATKQKSLRK